MKVLVTGGAGFVGTNLVKRLLKDGHDVISIDNYSTGKTENHQDGCRYLIFDCVDSEGWEQVKEFWGINTPDVIFHMAALARIQPSIKDPIFVIKNNFDSTLNVLEWVRNKNIPVVYAGSSSVHHGLYGSPYAWSKFSGEELCKLYSSVYDVPTSICRFYNVYGPYQIEDGTYATLLGIFQKQYEEGKPLTITGDGEQRRDFTHIDDIVDGLIRISRAMHGEVDMRYAGEIFELGSGVNYSINEVADMFDKYYIREYIPTRKGEYDITLCDYSKAELELGWKPTRNLKDYINKIK
jgi:UDP-glucose 4-epimerase